MKVLYAYRYGIVGGVSTQLMLRRSALAEAGIHCELYFSQDNGIGHVLSNSEGIHFGAQKSFARIVRNGHFDAVVVIDSPELMATAAGPIYRRNAVYLDVHTTTNTGLAYLSKIRTSKLAGVMVPTGYSAGLVRGRLPSATSIQVVPNILNTQLFSSGCNSAERESSEKACNASREYIWVGKLDHHKNWRLALVYAAMLQELFGDIHLHLVGGYTAPASQAEAFFQLAHRLGISHRVSWLDRVENTALVGLYRRCGASGGGMLVTSRDESFGMAAAEALLCGCPLIANDLPVFREVFPESPMVRRVDIWQPEQVAAAAQALSDPLSLDEIGNMHRQLAEKYGPHAFIDSFKKLLDVNR